MARMTLAGTVRSVPELISPTVRLRDSWLASREEWGRDARQDGAGLRAGDDVDSAAGFARWAGRLAGQADASRPAGEARVHASYRWITEDGTYLGAITLRHELDDFLLRAGGHIGYGIRPSARGRGLATWALQSVLVRCPAQTATGCPIIAGLPVGPYPRLAGEPTGPADARPGDVGAH